MTIKYYVYNKPFHIYLGLSYRGANVLNRIYVNNFLSDEIINLMLEIL